MISTMEQGIRDNCIRYEAKMSGTIRVLSFDQVLDLLIRLREPYHKNYLAMYSSWYGGITTDPQLMMVPLDDHLVHRGDGVFEAFKCVEWRVYALKRHLDRMQGSAAGLSLKLPMERGGLEEAILETIRAANVPNCLIRLFISRGPGGFSPNPYESPSSQVYVVVTNLHQPPKEKYDKGVRLKSSGIPVKESYFANLKSCNYLPNVLMKKEAEDAGVDFTVSLDQFGFLAEGGTENIGIVTGKKELLVPRFERILRGITITRVLELATALVNSGDLLRVEEADISPERAYTADEIMMFGTTFDVLPVVEYDGHTVGSGNPGPISARLLALLREDMKNSQEMLTSVKA